MFRLYTSLLLLLLAVSCRQNYSHSISSHELIAIDTTILDDTAVNTFIAPYRDTLEQKMHRIIGFNQKTMSSDRPNSPLSSMVADIMLAEGRKFIDSADIDAEPRPSLAIVNVRGLRTSLNAGDISIRDVFEIMPFENVLTAVLMKGEDVDSLFRHIATIGGDGLAGASFTITRRGAKNIMIDDQPLDSDQMYHVFVPDYLADGGDSYFVFGKAVEKIYTRLKLRDLIIQHIEKLTKQGKQITFDGQARIVDARKAAK
ncbi:MAG: 5'-nucleotidase C-terminal domain-containing protein [Cytophagaceae bacterium]|jgi:2',3'-cyclic-nucleotide 2'-phosphodiesterase (5'-nucleotidase family)|nr:5'-nucleotidase C-terminal domain-containing protein [Cytophagaceae bacterium]